MAARFSGSQPGDNVDKLYVRLNCILLVLGKYNFCTVTTKCLMCIIVCDCMCMIMIV